MSVDFLARIYEFTSYLIKVLLYLLDFICKVAQSAREALSSHAVSSSLSIGAASRSGGTNPSPEAR